MNIPMYHLVKMTAGMSPQDKIDMLRSIFITIMRTMEGRGYNVTGEDGEDIEDNMKKFFETEDIGTKVSIDMLRLISAVGATPEDLEDRDDGVAIHYGGNKIRQTERPELN